MKVLAMGIVSTCVFDATFPLNDDGSSIFFF